MNIDNQKIYEVIARVLKVSVDQINDELAVGDIDEWDSLAHVQLITEIEQQFEINLDIDQALEMESVEDIIDILSEILEK